MIHPLPVIRPEELKERLEAQEPIVVLDASYTLPGAAQTPYEGFIGQRIKGSRFFDLSEIRDKGSSLPQMLPSAEIFEKAAQDLGISHDSYVVIYGQTSMVMGPARAWWMFRVFGHRNVAVLDGTLGHWRECGGPLETGPELAPPRPQGDFKARLQPELVADLTQMSLASEGGTALILDARSPERFSGITPEPRAGLRAGHIPGSRNLPATQLVDNSSGHLKADPEIQDILQEAGFDSQKPAFLTCGSGVTACMLALGLYKLGYESVPVYDGSWSEWGLDTSEQKIEK